MLEVTIPEAERRMEELLNRVERGEAIAVIDAGRPRAFLVPLTAEEEGRPAAD